MSFFSATFSNYWRPWGLFLKASFSQFCRMIRCNPGHWWTSLIAKYTGHVGQQQVIENCKQRSIFISRTSRPTGLIWLFCLLETELSRHHFPNLMSNIDPWTQQFSWQEQQPSFNETYSSKKKMVFEMFHPKESTGSTASMSCLANHKR